MNLGISIRPFGHLRGTFEVKNINNNRIADIVGLSFAGQVVFHHG